MNLRACVLMILDYALLHMSRCDSFVTGGLPTGGLKLIPTAKYMYAYLKCTASVVLAAYRT